MELQVFREETRDWLESNCPQSMRIGAVHFEDAYELYQTDEALEWRDRAATPAHTDSSTLRCTPHTDTSATDCVWTTRNVYS